VSKIQTTLEEGIKEIKKEERAVNTEVDMLNTLQHTATCP
jgi:hypothetical protein